MWSGCTRDTASKPHTSPVKDSDTRYIMHTHEHQFVRKESKIRDEIPYSDFLNVIALIPYR